MVTSPESALLVLDDYTPDLDWHTVAETEHGTTVHYAEYPVEGINVAVTYSDRDEVAA